MRYLLHPPVRKWCQLYAHSINTHNAQCCNRTKLKLRRKVTVQKKVKAEFLSKPWTLSGLSKLMKKTSQQTQLKGVAADYESRVLNWVKKTARNTPSSLSNCTANYDSKVNCTRTHSFKRNQRLKCFEKRAQHLTTRYIIRLVCANVNSCWRNILSMLSGDTRFDSYITSNMN